MSRGQRWAAGIAFGLVVLAVAVAPFPLLFVPNPVPHPVSGSFMDQQPGVFVAGGGAAYHVFPRAEDVEAFPAEAPATTPDTAVWVRSKQLDDTRAYEIVSWPDGVVVPVAYTTRDNKLLSMTPKRALTPGMYCAHVSRDGLEGGTDFVYFRVTSEATASLPLRRTTAKAVVVP